MRSSGASAAASSSRPGTGGTAASSSFVSRKGAGKTEEEELSFVPFPRFLTSPPVRDPEAGLFFFFLGGGVDVCFGGSRLGGSAVFGRFSERLLQVFMRRIMKGSRWNR